MFRRETVETSAAVRVGQSFGGGWPPGGVVGLSAVPERCPACSRGGMKCAHGLYDGTVCGALFPTLAPSLERMSYVTSCGCRQTFGEEAIWMELYGEA